MTTTLAPSKPPATPFTGDRSGQWLTGPLGAVCAVVWLMVDHPTLPGDLSAIGVQALAGIVTLVAIIGYGDHAAADAADGVKPSLRSASFRQVICLVGVTMIVGVLRVSSDSAFGVGFFFGLYLLFAYTDAEFVQHHRKKGSH